MCLSVAWPMLVMVVHREGKMKTINTNERTSKKKKNLFSPIRLCGPSLLVWPLPAEMAPYESSRSFLSFSKVEVNLMSYWIHWFDGRHGPSHDGQVPLISYSGQTSWLEPHQRFIEQDLRKKVKNVQVVDMIACHDVPPHLHLVRRGEWNKFHLMHSIANGALAF